MAPEHSVSDGNGKPCRHCLRIIPKDAGMLILAHRPFAGLHPYAETGPIFLCADDCTRGGGTDVPEIQATSPHYLIKGYGSDNRIVYGSGKIVAKEDTETFAADTLADPQIAYLHVRSASNNCYLLRIDRD
jgi:hypothetical protein